MKLYEYQRSRSFIAFGPNLSDSVFLNFFSSITTGTIEAKFHVVPLWDGGMKAWSNGPGHIYTIKNVLLWNKKADDLQTW